MTLINEIGIDTRFGYRTIELHEADITDATFAADLLVLSAYAGSYLPSPGTIIEALQTRLGVRVSEHARSPGFDLRHAFGLWVSQEVEVGHFKRLLVVELIGGSKPVHETVENVFVAVSILEAKGVDIRTVAMPILGAGLQGIDPAVIMPPLLRGARQALERSSCLMRISFVERNRERAAILDAALNDALGRVSVKLPKDQLLNSLRQDVLTGLGRISKNVPISHSHLLDELRQKLRSDNIRSFEMGILGRRLAEFVADSLLGKTKTSPDLTKKIDDLAQLRVAPWIRGYMHTLRVLGNESAHEKSSEGRIPRTLGDADVALCLFCIQRITAFFEEYTSHQVQ